jgi:CHAT domain-containing protein/tetratricopeptide (TPR) repeat protein
MRRFIRAAGIACITAVYVTFAGPGAAFGEEPAQKAEAAPDIDALNKQALQLYTEGKYAEAADIAGQALAAAEKAGGPNGAPAMLSASRLASIYQAQGRYAEAEPLLKRVRSILEGVLGKEHAATQKGAVNLAELYRVLGRYDEAQPLYERAVEVLSRVLGPDNPQTITAVNNFGLLYQAKGQLDAAEPLFARALEAAGRVFGADDPQTLAIANNVAMAYRDQGRYEEAEPLIKRGLSTRERLQGPEHPQTLVASNNLAVLYLDQGRLGDAAELFKRVLDVRERVLGLTHPDTLLSVNNLASALDGQGRYAESLPLYTRAADTYRRTLGEEHPLTLNAINNLAAAYDFQGRYAEAEPLKKLAFEARERVLGPDHPDTVVSLNNLAALYWQQNRLAEAEPLYVRVVEASGRVLGKDHPLTATAVNNLGMLYKSLGRYEQAGPLLIQALEVRKQALGTEHPTTLISINNLALFYFEQGNWGRAAEYWRVSTEAAVKRTLRGAQRRSEASAGKKRNEAEQMSSQLAGLAKAVYRSASGDAAPELFGIAQWAQGSEAAEALAQMAVRSAKGDPALGVVVRERQDLLAEWQKLDTLRNSWLAQPPENRVASVEERTRGRLAANDARIAAIDAGLMEKFPAYAAMASPAPLATGEARAALGEDEALVLFFDTPELMTTPGETFVIAVTKTGMRALRSGLGTAELSREVKALRCGLDAEAWGSPGCAELMGGGYTEADLKAGKPLPFDHDRAHRLYKALFGQVADLIRGKQLLIVPSGPLTQLPFQVLVTARPATAGHKARDGHKDAAWLIRDHAITVLPAVSSLKALRSVARPSAAGEPMTGFGNPLLDGDPEDPAGQDAAERARKLRTCREKPALGRGRRGRHRGVAALEVHGGLASIAHIRVQAALPETAAELCTVGRDLGARAEDIHLGAGATERAVKGLSESGRLAHYRIVHFATHGALAGQVSGASEPGLILTPPEEASELDDGYLTASEIAGLRLDADWVILSACNTAAGRAQGAEALSGLGRAFIYAQARAMLVSHWAVDSAATVKLITGTGRRMTRGKPAGRAEALRRSMLDLIKRGEPHEAHPAFWAPFVLVGEGTR